MFTGLFHSRPRAFCAQRELPSSGMAPKAPLGAEPRRGRYIALRYDWLRSSGIHRLRNTAEGQWFSYETGDMEKARRFVQWSIELIMQYQEYIRKLLAQINATVRFDWACRHEHSMRIANKPNQFIQRIRTRRLPCRM